MYIYIYIYSIHHSHRCHVTVYCVRVFVILFSKMLGDICFASVKENEREGERKLYGDRERE